MRLIDESADKTNMMRLHGRSPKGERLVCHAPHGHWCTTTMISSVRLDGTTACVRNKYIKKATLNGKPLDTPFITYDQIMAGGTLTLELTDKPDRTWGTTVPVGVGAR